MQSSKLKFQNLLGRYFVILSQSNRAMKSSKVNINGYIAHSMIQYKSMVNTQ